MYKLYAACPLNTEKLLIDEIESLGGKLIKSVPSGVYFEGTLETVYRVCLMSRIAGRVHLILKEFKIANKRDVYDEVKEVNWQEHFELTDTFATSASVVKSVMKNSHYTSLLIKDAIADSFRDALGERPDIDPDKPSVRIHLHIEKNRASLSLDLSGTSLHKRGYRVKSAKAALKENSAAALLYRAGWPDICKEGGNFLDPMCGSGTLLIEAALIACNIPPGSFRHYFGFIGWKQHNPDLWDDIWDEYDEKRTEPRISIRGYDLDREAVADAIENIKSAGLEKIIHVEKQDIHDFHAVESMKGNSGLVCVNPPYGIRIGNFDELKELYRSMALKLMEELPGWKLSVITEDEDLSRAIPLKVEKVNTLFNGQYKCTVSHFLLEEEKVKKLAPLSEGAIAFKNRLQKRRKHLKKWARRQEISCYRVYDADLPDFNAAVDIYNDTWVCVSEYAPPKEIEPQKAAKRLEEIIRVIPEVLEVAPEHIYLKQRKRQKGKSQYQKDDNKKEFQVTEESGAKFYVNFTDYLDTGIFLDHRPVRKMIKESVQGKKFLNLFCYTGTASVLAALGGAESTTSVDASATYLKWAEDNLCLNHLNSASHRYYREDCRQWLKQDRNFYDIIFLDPPTFSNTKGKREVFDVQSDFKELIDLCSRRLAPEGVLYFSNNFRKFKMDYECFEDLEITEITRDTIDEDFKSNPLIHRCWKIVWKKKTK